MWQLQYCCLCTHNYEAEHCETWTKNLFGADTPRHQNNLFGYRLQNLFIKNGAQLTFEVNDKNWAQLTRILE